MGANRNTINAPICLLKAASAEKQALAYEIGNQMGCAEGVVEIAKQVGIDLKWPQTLSRWLAWYGRQRAVEQGQELIKEAAKQFVEKNDDKALWKYLSHTIISDAASKRNTAIQMSMLNLQLKAEELRVRQETEKAKLAMREKEVALERERFEWSAAEAALKCLPALRAISEDNSLTQEQRINAARLKLFGCIAE